jgi:hypothetical protein
MLENILHDKHQRNKQKQKLIVSAQTKPAWPVPLLQTGQHSCRGWPPVPSARKSARSVSLPSPNRFGLNWFWIYFDRAPWRTRFRLVFYWDKITPLYKRKDHDRLIIPTSDRQKHNTYLFCPTLLSTSLLVTSPNEIWWRSWWPCRF